jgi:hypothetical protein
MATVREHMSKEIHEAAAAYHDGQAEHENGLHENAMEFAALHRNFHKESGLTDGPHQQIAAKWENRAKLHKANIARHQEHAADHRAAAAKCSKGAEADFAKLVPDRVSSVVPTVPGFGSRAVLRTGQKEIGAPDVPLEFQSLVAIDDSLD